jgi:dihydroorotase-like cyclic amidohydrolase
VTTVFDMPNVNPPTNTVERLLAQVKNASAKSIIDFGHNASASVPEQIAGLAESGASAFKIFMMSDIGRDYPHMPGIAVDDHGTLLRICEESAATGLALYVHPFDQSIWSLNTQRAWATSGRDFRSYARTWRVGDGIVLDSGIATMLQLQRITGVRMHILHVSTFAGLDMIRAAKDAGQSVTAELNPMAVFLQNSWDEVGRLGPYSLGMWVPEADAAAAWDGLLDGTIDVMGTDHAPHTRDEKEIGWTDMFAAPGGSPNIQHYLGLMMTAASQGRIRVERIVDTCCESPARLVNLYPRKGVIAVGSDADLVIVDPDRKWTITAEDSYYKCGWTPLEGRVLTGKPIVTISRGDIIFQDDQILAVAGRGRFVGNGLREGTEGRVTQSTSTTKPEQAAQMESL